MRIRSVKPSFWRDSIMAGLDIGCRLFYIGLWMEADDAGYFDWSAKEIASDLFPYVNVRKRERDVERWAAELQAVGRLVRWDCGHGLIPRLAEHQRAGGKPSYHVQLVHVKCPPDGSVRIVPDQSGLSADDKNCPQREGSVKGGEVSGREVGGSGSPTPTVVEETKDGDLAFGAYACYYVRPNQGAIDWIDRLISRYGDRATADAIAAAGREGRDELLSRAQATLALNARRPKTEEPKPTRGETLEQRRERYLDALHSGDMTQAEFDQEFPAEGGSHAA